jgi:acetyltransferase-like isoleucine patch superfamily enzyme
MRMGTGTSVARVSVGWPHQVAVGRDSQLLDGVVLDYCHGTWRPGPSITIGDRCYVGRGAEFNCRLRITVGDDCLIAAGCRFVDHDHGMAVGHPMRVQDGPEATITVEDDVWLGSNVVVLKGVTIGRGAVVAAGAVVNWSIPAYEIWGGVPAKRLGTRRPATANAGSGGDV